MNLDAHRDEIIEMLKESVGNVPVAMKHLRHKTNCDLKAAYEYCDDIARKISDGDL